MFDWFPARLLIVLPTLVCLPVIYDLTASMNTCTAEVASVLENVATVGYLSQAANDRVVATCNSASTKGKSYTAVFGRPD